VKRALGKKDATFGNYGTGDVAQFLSLPTRYCLLFFRFAIIVCDIQGGQKVGPQTHDHNSVKSEPIEKLFTGRFFGKFVVKWILKLSPRLAYVATLPCETLMSAKQTINDKLVITR